MIKHIDSRRSALIFQKHLLIPYLVDLFYIELEKHIATSHRFNIALAGGSTPKVLYESIAKDKRALTAPWELVHVYFGDERAVALDHQDSNYKMSLEAGFNHLKNINIHPMQAYKASEEAVSQYESILPHHIDFMLLGMGDDGHTASLFPNDPLCDVKHAKVALGFIESKQAFRMSMTFDYINLSSKIIMLVTGESKKNMVKNVLSDQGHLYPAYQIGTISHPCFFVLDEAAGSLL